MPDPKVKVIIEAVDKATKTLGKITKTIVGGLGIAGVAALAGITVGAVKAGQAFIGMAIDAAKLSGVQNTFVNLSASINTTAISAIESLREATRGMVSDMDLMAAGNQFMAMGLANTEQEMSKLAEIATQLGSAMGSGPTAAMENFALLLANQSIPRLDTFGISSGVVRSRIEELQKETQGLSRETAFMQAVMEQAEITLEKVGEQGDTAAAALARMEAVSANLKTAIGQGLEPVVTNVLSTFGKLGQKLLPTIRTVFAGVGQILNQAFELFKIFGKSILKALGIDFNNIAQNSGEWGNNIVLSLARGMAAAMQAVVNVLMQLGQIIRSWLAPGSPPKLLPNLDAWGAAAATIYMEGWGEADFGIFNDLAGIIGGHLQSLSEDVIPKEMLIPWLNTFNAEIAAGINRLRETGDAGREVFDQLIDSAEFLPESIKEYARSLVDVQIAQELFNQTAEMMEKITEANRAELESLVATATELPQPFAEYAQALLDVGIAQDNLNALMSSFESIVEANRNELESLASTAGSLPAPFGDYIQALLDVEFAQDALANSMDFLETVTADLARAQDELNAITSAYDAILAPLNEELQAIQDRKQFLKDEERILKLQATIASETKSELEKAIAQAELEEIMAKRKIKAVEDEQDAISETAKAKVEAAKQAEDAAKAEVAAAKKAVKTAEEKAQSAKDLAKVEIDAAREILDIAQERVTATQELAQIEVDAAQEALTIAQSQLSVAQQLVQQQNAANSAMNEQVSILDGLKESLDSVAESMATGIGGAAEGLAGISESLGGSLGGIAESFGGLSDEVLAQVTAMFTPLETDFEALGELYGDIFSGLDQEGATIILEGVWESIKALFNAKLEEMRASLQEWILVHIQIWRDNFELILLGFLTWLLNLIINLKLKLAEFQASVDLWFTTLIQSWIANWEQIKLAFSLWMLNVITSLQIWLAGFLASIATWFAGLIASWQGNWEQIKLFFITLLANIITGLQEWIATFLASIVTFFVDFISTWTPEWQEVAAEFLLLLADMLVILQTWITDFLLNISEWFTNLITVWTEKWLEIKTHFTDWWNELIESLRGKLDTIIEDISEWFKTFITIWKDKYQEIKVAFTDWWNNLIKSLKGKLDAFIKAVTTFFTTLKTKWITKWNEIKTTFTTFWAGIKASFSTWVSDATNVGKNIVDGIKAGIVAKAGELSRKAAKIVKDAIAAARRAMNPGSPSKLAAKEVGAPIAQGIGLGFTKEMDKIRAAFDTQIKGTVRNMGRGSNVSTGRQVGDNRPVLIVRGDLVLQGVPDTESLLEQLNKLMR